MPGDLDAVFAAVEFAAAFGAAAAGAFGDDDGDSVFASIMAREQFGGEDREKARHLYLPW